MVIRITLKDNDFTDMLERFAKKIAFGYPISEDENNDIHSILENKDKYNKALSLSSDDLTITEKNWIRDSIIYAWSQFVGKDSKDRDYLINNFECNLMSSMVGEWENGETVYVFPTSYSAKYITL